MTSGTVDFSPAIPPGGHTYFSLEEALATQPPYDLAPGPPNLGQCPIPPTTPPRVVAVIVSGINSHIGGGSFNPLAPSLTYCSSADGITELTNHPTPVQDLIDGWKESQPPGPTNRMTDALASTGAVVLPFSYKRAVLRGKPAAPTFSFTGYTASDVANTDPQAAATTLNNELTSIHTVWPWAKIVVVGHSNGGLVAELWWIDYGSHNPQGVVQALSLDSPLNGIASGFCQIIVPCDFFGVGQPLDNAYATLWQAQATLEPRYLALDDRTNSLPRL